ncbi:ribosome assembly factor SBDS [Candidatus Woesearchaeota archaeon]|nr:ribosome assembly factor SBDS [Candidatus Woesearchaeota archaeon]|tara:strand:+ start:914 stop:1615 length:702 start_codon:yes stop_codon:yes gene_type:complete
MVTVDEAVIARLKTHGQDFEVLVDCNNAIAIREGKEIDMKDVLAAMKIFTDSKKGLEASETAMKQIFQTSDAEEVAKQIIKKGEIQLTSEYRNQLKENKRKQIINIIHRNGVDPKTHTPHPVIRIENAFEEAKFHVDEFTSVEKQVQEALKKIQPILPIKFEVKELAVKIGPEYAGKAYGTVKNYGTILREAWQNNGDWVGVIEMPGGLEEEFYEKLNDLCHGNAEVKVLKTK